MSNQVLLTSTNPAPLSWVESLFARMEGMYGSKFLDMWRGADISMVKGLWADEMGKLSADELKRGYAGLMARDWPPSLPEYVKMCKPTIDPLVAYQEAVNGIQARSNGGAGKWSHPGIYWAAVPMAFDLCNQTYSQVKIRWERSLSDSMERGQWDPVPEPLIALPEPAPLSKEEAGRRLREVGAANVAKDPMSAGDHKRWARLAIEDLKHGGKRYPAITYKMAKEALAA